MGNFFDEKREKGDTALESKRKSCEGEGIPGLIPPLKVVVKLKSSEGEAIPGLIPPLKGVRGM